MKTITRNANGFGIVAIILFVVSIGTIGTVAWLVWRSRAQDNSTSGSQSATAQNTTTSSGKVTQEPGWSGYESAEYGFKFRYPVEWGEPKVVRQALNNSDYEVNLPYIISFASEEAPTARIVPADWKFTPAQQTEWNYPLDKASLSAEGTVEVFRDSQTAVALAVSSFSGEISISGVKTVSLSKAEATQVEMTKSDSAQSKKSCLTIRKNSYDSDEEQATLACYTQKYRDDFVKTLRSFEQL